MKLEFQITKEDIITDTNTWHVRFKIKEISDEEIITISKLTPIEINFDPSAIGVTAGYQGPYGILQWPKETVFVLHNKGDNTINLSDIYKMQFLFKSIGDANKFKDFIEIQFEKEIQRIERVKKIYEGTEKVLDKKSIEYNEIVEKNRDAWKKLADL